MYSLLRVIEGKCVRYSKNRQYGVYHFEELGDSHWVISAFDAFKYLSTPLFRCG